MKKRLLVVALGALSTSVSAAIDINDNLSVSGFGSLSWARSDNETPLMVNRSINDENCFDCDTILGLQLDYYNDAFNASVQVVKRPQDNWSEPQLEWAYLGYTVGSVQVRAGRLRLPLFLLSEYNYVGHAYNTARPPEEVYNALAGVTAYNGLSAVWNYPLSDSLQLTATPYIGFKDTNDLRINPQLVVEVETQYSGGINLVAAGEYYRWNFAYLTSKYDQRTVINGGQLVLDSPDTTTDIYTLGAEYEFDALKLTAEGQTNDFNSSWYASVAYRINKLTPYAVYGQSLKKSDENDPYSGKDGDSITLGLRYDVLNNVSINGEWQRFKSYGEDPFGRPLSGPFIQSPGQDTDANLYTIMVNFVF
ncbi:sulfate ABC transporter permease [Vibrio sp. 10N]|uniref:sulfate ABC transporter permease n=1 Tax=Vibrio sp. 10N TaxID=3058938 RepID=UPI0028143969|nr:hypothetical protein VB10N_44350 [Vibrio sp. 10N]